MMANLCARAISVHYRDFEHAYLYWIWLRGSASYVIIAVHVRYKSLYISLPCSAKQQREMTKFCGVYETWTTPAYFSCIFPFGIERRRCICSCNTFLDPLAYRTDLARQSRNSLVECKFIFSLGVLLVLVVILIDAYAPLIPNHNGIGMILMENETVACTT